jgi:EAL domain-containing protein (putative c-di-GMP-specific phosphodiesterase class I)
VTASVGIALRTPEVGDAPTLLRCADVALYRAKAAGRAGHAVFAPGMNADALARLELEHELRLAVERRAVSVHYQPKVDLTSGAAVELEALARWAHPARGLVLPGAFLPLAEETGLIVPLGRQVLREACRQMVVWRAAYPGVAPPALAVNLSPRQFRHAELVADVAATLAATGLDAALLKLEITETAAMERPDEAIATLRALKALGVRLALDDFGTGYSSLAYLPHLPVDALTIDRGFFRAGAANRAIARAVTDLAHGLGLDVTAEGLETAAQVAWARDAGCDRGQGDYFVRPLPVVGVDALWAAGLTFDLPIGEGRQRTDGAKIELPTGKLAWRGPSHPPGGDEGL